jgi:hypothetical protein
MSYIQYIAVAMAIESNDFIWIMLKETVAFAQKKCDAYSYKAFSNRFFHLFRVLIPISALLLESVALVLDVV